MERTMITCGRSFTRVSRIELHAHDARTDISDIPTNSSRAVSAFDHHGSAFTFSETTG